MRLKTAARGAALVGAALFAGGAGLVRAAGDLCPMGGTMIRAEIDKEKALAWAKARSKTEVNDLDPAAWSVLARSGADGDIAVLVAPGYVFFAVAGRGGEVYRQDLDRALGSDLKKLREAIRKDLEELRAAGVAKIAAEDVLPLAESAGLGALEKQGERWVLTTRDCQAVDLPASGL